MLFSITLLPPVVIDIYYGEDAGQAFFYSYLLLLATGFVLWLPVRNKRYTSGVIDLQDGRMLYINRALGNLWPVRFNMRPEVTIFTLA